VTRLDAEFARELTLSVGICAAPLFENLTESFFFHLSYSARSSDLEFLPSVRQEILPIDQSVGGKVFTFPRSGRRALFPYSRNFYCAKRSFRFQRTQQSHSYEHKVHSRDSPICKSQKNAQQVVLMMTPWRRYFHYGLAEEDKVERFRHSVTGRRQAPKCEISPFPADLEIGCAISENFQDYPADGGGRCGFWQSPAAAQLRPAPK